MTVEEVDRLVRATTKPYPGAFYILDKKYKIVIWSGYVESKPNKSNFSIQFSNGYYMINEYTKYSLSDDK